MPKGTTTSNQQPSLPSISESYSASGTSSYEYKAERVDERVITLTDEKGRLLEKQKKLVPAANFLNRVAKYFPVVGGLLGLGAIGTSVAAVILDIDGRSKVELSAATVGLVLTSLVFCGLPNCLYCFGYASAPNVGIQMDTLA